MLNDTGFLFGYVAADPGLFGTLARLAGVDSFVKWLLFFLSLSRCSCPIAFKKRFMLFCERFDEKPGLLFTVLSFILVFVASMIALNALGPSNRPK